MAQFPSLANCACKQMVKRKFISRLDAGRRRQRAARKEPQRKVILIVCEGETEEAYFRAIKAHYRNPKTPNLKIVRDRSDPVRAVEKGIRQNKDGDFDHVFCIVDGDKQDRIALARQRIGKRENVELVLSVPCFEIWLLLHFAPSDAPFAECAAVCARLRDYLPDYAKGLSYDFGTITSRIDDAIDNAHWLAGRKLANPLTDVHRVFDGIRPAP
jgi:hypothetical protein